MVAVRLVLVRHASTDWTVAGRFNGWTDVPLNERGRREAESLREKLQGRSWAGVWSSDLTRAVETAVHAFVDPQRDARLRELDFGRLEGKRWEECSAETQRDLLSFDRFRAPEGESVDELRARLRSFFRDVGGGDHLVFTHGGVIRCLLRDLGRDARTPLASVTSVDVPGDHELLAGLSMIDD